MEINYYPFDHTFQQVCLMEESNIEKEKKQKALLKEREMMEAEDVRVNTRNLLRYNDMKEAMKVREEIDEGTI